jgi:excisionase family DNA binding protein
VKQETNSEIRMLSCASEIEKKVDSGYSGSRFFENEIATKWLSTVDAAHFLCVSENAIRIMVHRGQIESYKFGRRLRFKLTDCQKLILKKGAA